LFFFAKQKKSNLQRHFFLDFFLKKKHGGKKEKKKKKKNSMGHSVVSAPGKVLIVGGYLVLDPGYTGAVLTSSARIYSDCEFRELKKENEIQGTMNVNLTASQFLWSLSYVYHFNEEDDCGKIVPMYSFFFLSLILMIK